MKNEINFSAFECFPAYCFLINEEANIIKVNESYLKKMNLADSQIIGKRIVMLFEESSIYAFERTLIKCEQELQPQEMECQWIANDNTTLYIRLFIAPTIQRRSPEGQTFLVIGDDITEFKKKEIDLLRFAYVAENTVNPLQITDVNGNMIYVNPAFCKASGYTSEELLGKNPSVFGSKKNSRKFWSNVWQTIGMGKVWSGEVENRKKNGEPFFTQLLISPILNDEKKVIGHFGIHRDLTDRRNLEKQLMHTQKMESIGTLAAGVAHEVGNPLASISALVQIIQRRTQDDFTVEKLELVKKQITRISKIIRDLVDFSRPSNFELKLTDINENIMESVEIVRVGKKAKDVEFVTELDQSLTPLRIVSDQVQQVFVNILINAVDAIVEKRSASGTSESGIIKVSSSNNDDHFTLVFEDNGIGVKDQNVSKIFEPFFTTKTEGAGTGLGLWVSYGIIKSFQGDIRVESKYKEWTRFIIQLPINPSF